MIHVSVPSSLLALASRLTGPFSANQDEARSQNKPFLCFVPISSIIIVRLTC